MTRQVLVISAGLRTPSSTRLLADRLAAGVRAAGDRRGLALATPTVELREHARDLTATLLTGTPTPDLDGLLAQLRAVDALVLVTPIYSGAYTGMVKDLVDVAGDALAGLPTLIGGTGGTVRHALALDHTLRPLLGHVHALVAPTAVFAATEDFGAAALDGGAGAAAALERRVHRAADELADLLAGRPARTAADPFDLSAITDLLRGTHPADRA